MSRRGWIGALAAAGLVAGLLSMARTDATHRAAVPSGRVTVVGQLTDDLRRSGFQFRAPMDPTHLLVEGGWERWAGPRLALEAPVAEAQAGDTVVVAGRLRPWAGWVRGEPVSGVLEAGTVDRLGTAPAPLFQMANLVRKRVGAMLSHRGPPGVLLAGFLIGEVSALPASDRENLRLAGLSHFVAVSGSNVALFLAALFIAAGPLGWSPGRRAVVGLLGLALFAVVTRWEPSVIRASVMAGLVLVGRVSGIALTAWAALGWAVVASLVVAPQLVDEVGFQLSVFATAGVLAGSRMVRSGRPSWVLQSLGVTLGAQAAVAPLLLWHFGSVPMMAPLTNLVAAPLVSLATVLAGLGVVTGLAPVIDLAGVPAAGVLGVARVAAGWPQLGAPAVLGAGLALIVWHRARRARAVLVLALSLVMAAAMLPPGRVAVPTAVFLDVGQGDAALLLGPDGAMVLVDGGPDPSTLLGKLRAWGVDHLDLVVATHGDLDHIGGLGAVIEAVPVGELWHPGHSDGPPLYGEILELAARHGVATTVPRPGWRAEIGSFSLEVLGPHRRFAAINDESIVLRVSVSQISMLLSGDIERTAQAELGPVAVDVLKVPHHGAATTDLAWLAASAAPVAVISVGPNEFGHPAPEVVGILQRSGADIRRTDHEGDIVIPFGP